MQLSGTPFHLAYCTNIHPAETWEETLAALSRDTLRVRDRIGKKEAFAIGLRLSDRASRDLLEGDHLSAFRRWLDREGCYVFTINGFPYGQFHGAAVKEQVYRPDWTTPERLEYTLRLFEILGQIVPEGCEGSVSTLPGSFKEFRIGAAEEDTIYKQAWECARGIAGITERTGKTLHLGFEPEPLGWFEDVVETARFFERLREHPDAVRELDPMLGVNYDTCHMAIEFEEPTKALQVFATEKIRVSKVHLSSAIQARVTSEVIEQLRAFVEPTYLHQAIVRDDHRPSLTRYRDLPQALESLSPAQTAEARVHFHVPLHWRPEGVLGNTMAHTEAVLNALQANPSICSHLEIETYTWGVLPTALQSADVVDQLSMEYEHVLGLLD